MAAWAGLTSFILLKVIDLSYGLRVPLEHEILGADIVEHAVGDVVYDKKKNMIVDRRETTLENMLVIPQFNEARKEKREQIYLDSRRHSRTLGKKFRESGRRNIELVEQGQSQNQGEQDEEPSATDTHIQQQQKPDSLNQRTYARALWKYVVAKETASIQRRNGSKKRTSKKWKLASKSVLLSRKESSPRSHGPKQSKARMYSVEDVLWAKLQTTLPATNTMNGVTNNNGTEQPTRSSLSPTDCERIGALPVFSNSVPDRRHSATLSTQGSYVNHGFDTGSNPVTLKSSSSGKNKMAVSPVRRHDNKEDDVVITFDDGGNMIDLGKSSDQDGGIEHLNSTTSITCL